MPLTMLFDSQELSFSVYNDLGGLHGTIVEELPFQLQVKAAYRFVWDGTEYAVTASEMSFNNETFVCIGNKSLLGGDDTGEPFLAGILLGAFICVTSTTDTTHTISVLREESAEYVMVTSSTFSDLADSIRQKTGATDAIKMSAMASLIDGLVVSSGTNVKVTSGWIPSGACAAGESYVVTHNLGIRPDLIMLIIGPTSDLNAVVFSYGFGSDFISATGYDGRKGTTALVGTTSDNHFAWHFAGTIDQDKGDCITSANATTFTAFTDIFKSATTAEYYYVVIGGLV